MLVPKHLVMVNIDGFFATLGVSMPLKNARAIEKVVDKSLTMMFTKNQGFSAWQGT